MSESNGSWGTLAEADSELAEAWDGYVRLPDEGQNPALDGFCAAKRITLGSLVRQGARLSDDHVLAFAYPGGIKYRDVLTGRRWAYHGSTWDALKIVPTQVGASSTVIVCEGETDGARLSDCYEADVAIMPAGARTFKPDWYGQLEGYELVLVALDDDEAGNTGATNIISALPRAMRFTPPQNDWCDTPDDELPPLPTELERTELPLIVPGAILIDLEEPLISSWYEHALLPVGGLAVVHGWVKSYKSFITMDMLSLLAQGEPWAGFEPTEEPCRTLVVQYEIPWPYYRQRVLQLRASAQDVQLWDENFNTWSPLQRPRLRAGDKAEEDMFLRAITDAGIQVVLIDPIRRAVGEADLNAENEVRKMLGLFERINAEGITVVATHHDSKQAARSGGGDPLGMTGSGAWAGDPDTIVSISLPRGDDFRNSTRRNIDFTLRNAPAVGGRAFDVTDSGIHYTTEPWDNDQDPTAPEI